MDFFLIHFSVSSQEMMTVKNKQFKGTGVWNFISTNYTLGGEVQVQLAKTENGGLLKLSVVTTNPKSMIAGTVYVYLSDNSFISCIDKGQFENTENSLSSYFNFTAAEMNKLKKPRFKIYATSLIINNYFSFLIFCLFMRYFLWKILLFKKLFI